MYARWLSIPAAVLGVLACSTLETGTISLVFGRGDNEDPFTEPACESGTSTPFCGPMPTKITISEVTLVNGDGGLGEATTNVATEPYSAGSLISLPQISSNNVDRMQATAFDSDGAAIIFGQTLPVAVGGVNGLTLDLFVQRKGQFAVLPAPLPSAPDSPLLATVFEGRYILVTSQRSEQAFLYDLLLWEDVQNSDGGQSGLTLPCKALSVAPVEGTTFVLVLCDSSDTSTTPAGACAPNASTNGDLVAYTFDVSGYSCTAQTCANGEITGCTSSKDNCCPDGKKKWSDVAGGATIIAPNGDAFIVGGTRPASLGLPATKQVAKMGLAVAGEGGISSVFATFLTPFSAARLGAAATWSTSHGLVIAGGNQQPNDPGVESIGGATIDGGMGTAVPTTYPSDPTQGAGALMLDDNNLLVAGGTLHGSVAPTRLFPGVTCASKNPLTCNPQVLGTTSGTDGGPSDAGVTPLVPLLTAQGFAEPDASGLFVGVGTAKGGDTQAFFVTSPEGGLATAAREVPLRVKRTGTTAVKTPVPSVVVVGGDRTMESFIP